MGGDSTINPKLGRAGISPPRPHGLQVSIHLKIKNYWQSARNLTCWSRQARQLVMQALGIGARRCQAMSNATSKPTTSPPSPLCRKTTTRRHVPHDRECLAGLRGQGCADDMLWDWKGSGRRKRCAIEEELEVLTDLWGERREGAGGRVGVGIHAGAEGRSTAQVFHSSHPFEPCHTALSSESPFCTGHPPC